MPQKTPSRAALATRSWTRVQRLTGEAKREAMVAHFETFQPAILARKTCPLTRF
jgi:hypothetical protein